MNYFIELETAMFQKDIPAIRRLLAPCENLNFRFRQCTCEDRSLLYVACDYNVDRAFIREILERGARANYRNWNKDVAMHAVTRQNDIRLLDLLAEFGAHVTVANRQGHTPLHIAAVWETAQIIQWLANHDADLEARDRNGKTSLHLAAIRGRSKGVAKLLELGANPDARDNNGVPAVRSAAKYGNQETLWQFVRHGAWDRLDSPARRDIRRMAETLFRHARELADSHSGDFFNKHAETRKGIVKMINLADSGSYVFDTKETHCHDYH